MADDLRDLPARSPAARVAHEAVELAIQGRSPYSEKAMFIDADDPHAGAQIRAAADERKAIVVVDKDGSTRVLHPETVVR
jgi:hypothetical protein